MLRFVSFHGKSKLKYVKGNMTQDFLTYFDKKDPTVFTKDIQSGWETNVCLYGKWDLEKQFTFTGCLKMRVGFVSKIKLNPRV